MILVWGVVHAVPGGGGGLRRQLQDAAPGWANEALFSEPWSIVMYNEHLMYTHTQKSCSFCEDPRCPWHLGRCDPQIPLVEFPYVCDSPLY